MTIEDIRQLHRYNCWANRRTFEGAGRLSPEEYLRDLKSSHGGIHGTLTHLVAAEKMWLSRWKGTPDAALLQPSDVSSFADLRHRWEAVDADLESFLATMTDDRLRAPFTMKTTNGDVYVHQYGEAMQHLFNHSTYHRGQVASLIRQAGGKPDSTDLIAYYRIRQSNG